MQAAIAIESIEGDSFDDGETHNWRDYKRLLSGKTLKPEKVKTLARPGQVSPPRRNFDRAPSSLLWTAVAAWTVYLRAFVELRANT
jgi:hypothetical protein